MVGALQSVASGWDQGSEVRAWTSRTQSFSSRGLSINMSGGNFSAEPAFARLLELKKEFGPRFFEELSCLFQEPSSEVFFNALLNFGLRLESQGKIELAAEVYSAIVGAGQEMQGLGHRGKGLRENALNPAPYTLSPAFSGPPLQIREKAEIQLNAILGKGSTGPRAEFLLRQFSEQATDPAAIFAMGAAGATFKLVRLSTLSRLLASPARNLLTSGVGARATAGLVGFSAEAPAFTLAGKLGNTVLGRPQDWGIGSIASQTASAAVVLGSLKFVGWGASVGARQLGSSSKIFPQAGMFGGILIGHRLETAVGLRDPQDGATTLTDSLVTLLHFNVAGHLTRSAFGEKFHTQQREWDLQSRRLDRSSPALPLVGRLHPALVPAGGPVGELEIQKPSHLSQMSSLQKLGSGLSNSQAEDLLLRFRTRFPQDSREIFSDKILKTVLRLSAPFENFHERLLEALVQSPDPGKRHQLYSVRAIEEVLNANATKSSTGSFNYALFEKLLHHALTEPRPPQRRQVMAEILHCLRNGLIGDKLSSLFVKWGYGEIHKIPKLSLLSKLQAWFPLQAPKGWREFRRADRAMLYSFAREESKGDLGRQRAIMKIFAEGRHHPGYKPAEIETALDFARDHPQSKMVLRRLLQIFAVRDIPAKLRELSAIPHERDTAEIVARWHQAGKDVEHIAPKLNGTGHTAYLENPSLARKVAAVMVESGKYLADPSAREPAKQKLDNAILDFLKSERAFDSAELQELLRVNLTPAVRAMTEMVRIRQIVLEVVSEHRLQLELKKLPGVSEGNALFIQGSRGSPARLLIKALPDFDPDTWEGQQTAYVAIVHRMANTIHEFEHWRHSNGHFHGPEKGSSRIDLVNPKREERLASEIMADLEEEGWRIAHLDADTWEIARQLGQPLALFLRDFNDEGYFRKENEARLGEIFPQP